MRIDFHVHTNRSDGKNSIAEMVAAAKRKGLDGIAVTDHDIPAPKVKFPDFLVIPGVEVRTELGDVIVLGTYELPPKNFEELLDWVEANNALAFAPHPFDLGFSRHSLGEIAFEKFEIIEVINGRSPRKACEKALFRAMKEGKIMLSNSDAHSVFELGKYWNEVKAEEASIEDVLEALRKGNVKPNLELPGAFDFIKNRILKFFA